MDKMLVNMVIDNGSSYVEYEFASFTAFCKAVDNGELDKDSHIHTIYYKNENTEVEFDWNQEDLEARGYTTVNDVYYSFKNNLFVIR